MKDIKQCPMHVFYDHSSREDGEPTKVRGAACFGGIYGSLNTQKQLKVYVPIDYILKNFTMEDILLYNKYLRAWKLVFDFEEDVEIDNKHGKGVCYIIDMKQNKVMAVKLMLNLIRIIYETQFPWILKTFLHLVSEEYKEVNNFTKLLIAHSAGQPINGHNFVPYSKHAPVMTKEEFERLFIKEGDANTQVNSIMPASKKSRELPGYYDKDKGQLKQGSIEKLIHDGVLEKKSPKEIITAYLEAIK